MKDSGVALPLSMLTLMPCLLTAAVKRLWVTCITICMLYPKEKDSQQLCKFWSFEKEIISELATGMKL